MRRSRQRLLCRTGLCRRRDPTGRFLSPPVERLQTSQRKEPGDPSSPHRKRSPGLRRRNRHSRRNRLHQYFTSQLPGHAPGHRCTQKKTGFPVDRRQPLQTLPEDRPPVRDQRRWKIRLHRGRQHPGQNLPRRTHAPTPPSVSEISMGPQQRLRHRPPPKSIGKKRTHPPPPPQLQHPTRTD